MLRRIPVSLKFDDETESEFYYNLIEQKRIDRELTNLICDLLHVYYENEDVRATVDNYQNAKNPYLLIQENLKRIAIEHSRNVMSASMLSDYTENEKRNLEKAKEKESKGSDSEDIATETKSETEVYEKIDSSPALLEGIKDRYNLTEKAEDITEKSSDFSGRTEPIIKEASVKGPIKFIEDDNFSRDVENQKQSKDSILNDKIEVNSTEKVEKSSKLEDVEESKVANVQTVAIPIAASKPSNDAEKVDESMEKPIETPKVKARKPASFGKLIKSLENE